MRKFSPDEVSMKKSGLWPTLGVPWKSTFSSYDPIGFKHLLQGLDEALMALGTSRGGCRRYPPPYPTPSAAKSKRGWHNLGAAVTILSCSEQRLVEVETQGSSDEALSLI